MSDNKNELDYNDIEEIDDINDALNNTDNKNQDNNDDKKSNLTENRYEDTEKKEGDNNEDNISEIYKNNKNKIENNQSTLKFQENEENIINNNINNEGEINNNNINSNNNINQNYNNITSINNNRNFDSKLHVRNPVPLSKLQIAENKYYQIKAEIEEKFFNNNLDNLDTNENAKYTQEMISYLEKLNDVLTQIISNTKIKDQKSGRNKSPSQVKDPELLYQEQQKLNDNSEKLIEVYKKQLTNLQNRLDIVSNPDYLPNLKYENEQLDREIYDLQIKNKKLKNTEKLNDIVISKQNKGENKSAIILKRLKMDYDNIKRQNNNFLQKVEKNKLQEEENEKKINQLNEWVEKLRTIAKDMYNITEYENIKTEEKNEKKLSDKKNVLIKNIEILQKVKNTNQKKYELEISTNEKTILELQETKKNLELRLQNEKDNYPQYENIAIPIGKNNQTTKKKTNNNTPLPEATPQEREAIMKEIEKVQKQKEEMMNIINQNENNIDDNNNKKGQKPFIKPFKDLQRQNSKNDISNINPMIENSNFGLNGENENRSLLNNTKENEPFLEKDEIEGNEEENEKDDNNEYMENEEKENKDEENNEEKNVIVNKENSDVPKFLEGFDDNEKDVEIIKKDNEKDDDTNEVIKERKNKMEILQKESMKNILEEKKKKEEEEEIKKKLPPNEFEDIEEFQI
jgi:hypothetical protein